jgi:hypothetical protein
MIHGDDYTFYNSWTEILMQFRGFINTYNICNCCELS